MDLVLRYRLFMARQECLIEQYPELKEDILKVFNAFKILSDVLPVDKTIATTLCDFIDVYLTMLEERDGFHYE